MTERTVDLSVIIPAYNEQANCRRTIEDCKRRLDGLGLTYEIIIIDDASTDDTGVIVDALAAGAAFIRVIHNPINLNVGANILLGFQAARGRLVTHNAMDLPFDPSDLAGVIPMFDDPKVGVVVFSRIDRSAHSLWRKIASVVHHWMVRALFLINVSDLNFVQVYRRSILPELRVRSRSPAFVTPELIIRAHKAGFGVVQVTAQFHPRKAGKGNFGWPRDILWTLADMFSFWLEGAGKPRGPGRV